VDDLEHMSMSDPTSTLESGQGLWGAAGWPGTWNWGVIFVCFFCTISL